jgi:putative restriction endonuclease
MSLYIYPTDHRWFTYLRRLTPLDEVNFWQPGGGSAFNRLAPGDLFLFRLKSPINRIAGGGFFTHGSVFPISAAWSAFGEKNGVGSYSEFFEYIAGYRRKAGLELHDDSPIGCIILQNPFFLPEEQWIDVPADFSLNLVQGRRYSDEEPTAAALREWAAHVLVRQQALVAERRELTTRVDGPVYGVPTLARRRLGQGTFRLLISDTYERRCAVTGERTLPVLEAAHIKPVSRGGEHRLDNGLLLRSDLHRLFDLGYLTVTSAGKLRVSPKLRETWLNGRVYYDLDGRDIRLPKDEPLRPSNLFLEWHNDTLFRR